MEENKSLSVPSLEEPPIQHSQLEPFVEGSQVMQATSNKSRVLLQVVPELCMDRVISSMFTHFLILVVLVLLLEEM